MPMACTRSSTELVETPLDLGLLHRCRKRIPGHPPRFEKGPESRSACAAWEQCEARRRQRLPAPVAIAVALPFRIAHELLTCEQITPATSSTAPSILRKGTQQAGAGGQSLDVSNQPARLPHQSL